MTFVYGALQPTVTPVVQVSAPHGEIGVADVLVNIVSLIGVLAVLVVVIGLATGGLFILFRRWRDGQSDESALASYTRLGLSAGDQDPGRVAAASAAATASGSLTSTPRS
jgi:hypothetical protein